MRFSRPLLFSGLFAGALALASQMPNASRAPSDQTQSPRAATVRAPTLGGPRALLDNEVAAPAITMGNSTTVENVEIVAHPAPTAALLPAPPPIPENQRVRVGLSTAGGTLAISAPLGLILTDARQNGRALRSKPGEIVQFSMGAPVEVTSGNRKFRGPIALEVGGRASRGWQWVRVSVPAGQLARVVSDGKDARYGRPYRGGFEVFPQQGAEPNHRVGPLAVVNVVGMEDYLKGVVPWEMDSGAPLEALKAQAVCARSETINFKETKRFAAARFDICDYDACQGYPGTENEKPDTSRAVEATRGLVLMSGNRIADAVYGTNSGGLTADADDVWKNDGKIPYLASVRDWATNSPLQSLIKTPMSEADWMVYCSQSWPSYARPSDAERATLARRRASSARTAALYGPEDEPEFYRWKRFLTVADVGAAMSARGFDGVTSFEVLNRAPSGHIKQLKIVGLSKPAPGAALAPGKSLAPLSLTLVGDGAIRAMFSGQLGSTTALPSSTFVIAPRTDPTGRLSGWQFVGAGWGHGVGLCQRGAQNHAAQGWDARRILGWYFRGVEVRKLY